MDVRAQLLITPKAAAIVVCIVSWILIALGGACAEHGKGGDEVVGDGSDFGDPDLANAVSATTESVVLLHTSVTDDGLRALSHATRLKEIGLVSNTITDAGLRRVLEAQCSGKAGIERVVLRCPEVRDFTQVGRCGALTLLDVAGSSHLFDSAVKTICGQVELEYLDVSRTPISNSALSHIAESCRRLAFLGVSGTAIDDAAMFALHDSPARENLEALDLSETAVGSRTAELLANFPNLRQVDLSNTAMSASDVSQLRDERPDLDVRFYVLTEDG